MKRDKVVDKILSDLHLPKTYEDYIYQTLGRLGCAEPIDIDTVKAVETVIKKELSI